MLTNVLFDASKKQIKLKFFREATISSELWNHIFYAKRSAIQPGVGYKVESSDKKHFLTKEKVDRITVLNNKSFEVTDDLYLYDLLPEYQYLVYKNQNFSDDYVVGYLKIEGESPILFINVLVNGDVRVFNLNDYESEKLMLEDFFKWIVGLFPDVILNWNDKKHLLDRAKILNVKFDIDRFSMIEFINMADVVLKKFTSSILKDTGGFTLNDISKYFLNRSRKENCEVLESSLNDLLILEELDDKLQLFNFLKRIQKISGVLLRHTFYNSIVVDSMILRRYPDLVFPSVKSHKEDVGYEGGFVLQPPRGIFKNIAVVDFQSMYPSIILTFNISPDSKTSKSPDYKIGDIGFKSNPPGIFKQTIEYLYNERLKLKSRLRSREESTLEYKNLDTLQLAYKLILNSFYGVCAFKKFRLYDIDLAKSITSIGRSLINEMKNRIEERGLGKVFYIDTDSLFIYFNVEPPTLAIDAINSIFIPDYVSSYGIKENFLFMEFIDLYDKMILFGKKKKYVAQKDNKIISKGFDTEKHDVPKCARELMKEIIVLLFNGKQINFEEYRKRIRNYSLVDYVILKKVKNKLTKFLIVKDDMIVLDEKNPVELDYDKYFRSFIINRMRDLYDIFGVKYA